MKKSSKKSFRLIVLILIVGGLYFLAGDKSGENSTFTPSSSASLHDGKSYLDPAGQKEAEKSLAETQKVYDSYNASTDVFTRVGTLMRIYGYQDSLGRYTDAKKTLESVLTLQTNPNTLRLYALLVAKMGDTEEAITYIDKAIALAPALPDFWNTKIDFLRVLNKNNLKNLDSTYLDALKKTNNNIDMVAGYAHYLEQMGRKSESITYYKKASEMNPAGKYEYQDAITRQQ